MKLRNKHTGETKEFNEIFLTKIVKETDTATSEYVEHSYCKIAELNADWEDYEPDEPLIKSKEIREEIKLFAYRNEIGCFIYQDRNGALYNEADNGAVISLEVSNIREVEHLVDGCLYTLDELCGEEEE